MDKRKILVVDDEPTVRTMLRMVFEASVECEVTLAENGQEALGIMERERYDVIVSDMSMPVMDGAELLNVVQELYPQTMRAVLSARSGGDSALRTSGPAHQYFLKPDALKLISEKINQVMMLRDLLPDQGLDTIVAQVKSLPSLPDVYVDLEKEILKPDADLSVIGSILERDISMSAKVLQLVNSAFFGLRERVAKPSQAAMLLGVDVLKSLVLAVHLFSEWKQRKMTGFDLGKVWDHSMNVASSARDIACAEGVDGSLIDDIYVGGLFHDIGKLILADNLPESCESIYKLCVEKKISLLEAEREVLGATHAETGAYLLCLWGFPESMVNAVAFHHQPSKSERHGFSSLLAVHVANAFDNELNPPDVIMDSGLDVEYIEAEGFSDNIERWREGLSG